MQLHDPDPNRRGLPRLKRSASVAASVDAVEPVTTFDTGPAVWRIVGQEAGLRPSETEVGDVLTITAFSEVVGGLITRLLSTWLVAVNDVTNTSTDVSLFVSNEADAVKSQTLTPVEAAKVRWQARALQESRLFERIQAVPADIDGLPAPPTSDDDGV